MFRKILIANRGEIAVRIIRACGELDIRSVAIHSEADRYSLHVKKADEAHSLGDDPVSGYLDVDKIVSLAVENECDAIHPGYGFLSENPKLAQACAAAGITFIGPSADVIATMGDKTTARQAMMKAGIPVTPGSDGNVESLEEAIEWANKIGYPIMLKATSGGGGRGIRRCDTEEELRHNYSRVISEATKAFGSAEVFLEKCVVNPHHIEVQVLADYHGNCVHLFERDCSIQRRNQKLIEIAPSPQLDDAQRQYIGGLAVMAARAVGYTNAGTIEFLLDQEGHFYFMEMNTRIQVEHTITETITGIDLVRQQILIASGAIMPFKQHDIQRRGFAMQFRVNAEDPKNNFLPSFGRISRYYAPGGPGVRTDGMIYTGYTVPPYYDSMLAKIIVWALTWEEVVNRGYRALLDTGLDGVKSTIPFYLEILDHSDFKSGHFDTSFLETHPELLNYSTKPKREDIAAVLVASLLAHSGL